MHLFISAGEPSGDQHAAQLVNEIRQRRGEIRVSGFGGPELAAAGQEQLFRLTDMAVMGIMAVLPLIFKFYRLYREAAEFLKKERPDAVLLVDFPGFNWWIAAAAKRAGVPVYFYCPPQLWAWASWRIRKVRKFVDCILSVLPFEAQWYRDQKIDVEYVGHPFFDEVAAHTLDPWTLQALESQETRKLAVLPGSRKQEVQRNFPLMLKVLTQLHHKHPDVRFPVACYKAWHRDRCAELVAELAPTLPIDLYVGRTSEVIETADCCFMVSGSVSLELLARRKPAVVVYRAGAVMGFLARLMIRCKYMTLPNLIAGRAVMPEFPCYRAYGAHVDKMIDTLDSWLTDDLALARSQREISELADSVVQAGGLARAAETLLRRMETGQAIEMRVPAARRPAA
ncbi:lipid-A-disaccharide synthase [Planctomicrobium piriforme]|uniref:Lipid-A-disaccharide synthase n=1 Tax=Planctomicrobium piriforme TaxID=1576369 RepID=A0A1I3FSQ5_9PLAN|nr:lipid-A-disaccharide synthase [Planctomicrobium piriforme]SFI14240.1 lipid-A-disaccharide synthase [Planctomicrobium piriforme]